MTLLAVVTLMGGEAIRDEVGWSDAAATIWAIARWPLALASARVALLFERAPRRRQPEWSWLAVGASVSAGLWLMFMGLLMLYFEATGSFGATYGPLAGTIGVLLWSFLTSVALFLGLALAAQLEAVRAGVPEPRLEVDASGAKLETVGLEAAGRR